MINLIKDDVKEADELAQQVRQLALHSDAQRRQVKGKLNHFASRGDVLASSFAAGCVKGAVSSDRPSITSFIPTLLRLWM